MRTFKSLVIFAVISVSSTVFADSMDCYVNCTDCVTTCNNKPVDDRVACRDMCYSVMEGCCAANGKKANYKSCNCS